MLSVVLSSSRPLHYIPPERERYQIPRQERPPHADPCEETLQVSLWQELQDLAGPEAPHHQLPPARLHGDPPQDSRLEHQLTPASYPKTSALSRLSSRIPNTKGSSACFKLVLFYFITFVIIPLCIILLNLSTYYNLYFFFVFGGQTIYLCSIFFCIDEHLHIRICYHFFSQLFYSHKVLTVKNRKKRQKNKRKERGRPLGEKNSGKGTRCGGRILPGIFFFFPPSLYPPARL